MVIVVIIACTLGLFVFGCYIMGKIDDFLVRSDALPDISETKKGKSFALVFGCSMLADKLILLLEKHGIDYKHIGDENQLDQTSYYSHLFAISEDDLKNLMINVIINKTMEICEKLAVCNNIDNQKIYEQNKLRCFYGINITAEILFYTMFPVLETPKENIDD